MTREEAIERFENVKANALVQKASGVSTYWQNEIDGTIEAIDMAIEALQTDAVSREDYEDIIKDYRKQYENMNNEIADLEAKLADAVHIHNDGTLEVKVPNAQNVGRVLVMDTDSHIGGGLFYPDDGCDDFVESEVEE